MLGLPKDPGKLRPVIHLKRDTQVTWRFPGVVRKAIGYWCEREARSENDFAVVAMVEFLVGKAKEARLVFVDFKFVVPTRIGPIFAKFLEEEAKKLESKHAGEFSVVAIKTALEAFQEKRDVRFFLPRSELEIFREGSLEGISAELFLCLKEAGIKPQTIKSGLYEFTWEEPLITEDLADKSPNFPFRYGRIGSTTDDLFLGAKDRQKIAAKLVQLVKEGRFRIGA